jgi:hypothetical protein
MSIEFLCRSKKETGVLSIVAVENSWRADAGERAAVEGVGDCGEEDSGAVTEMPGWA